MVLYCWLVLTSCWSGEEKKTKQMHLISIKKKIPLKRTNHTFSNILGLIFLQHTKKIKTKISNWRLCFKMPPDNQKGGSAQYLLSYCPVLSHCPVLSYLSCVVLLKSAVFLTFCVFGLYFNPLFFQYFEKAS